MSTPAATRRTRQLQGCPPVRPLDVVQVIRDGGGTAPVELTVAARLRARGHQVRLYGPPEVCEHARAAGFDLRPLDWPAELGPRGRDDLIPRMVGASLAWARQLTPQLRRGDVVVADCTVFGALMAAKRGGVPTAALMPTVYVAGTPGSAADGAPPPAGRADLAAALAGINRARGALALPAVASLTGQVLDVDRLLVLTSRAFELPHIQPPAHVRYVGPQLPGPDRYQAAYRLPEGAGPLVLVSLSTTDQGQADLLRRLLAAIGTLPVRALVTVGPAVDTARLQPPGNAVLETFVPHPLVLPHAAVVITHAGHGTVMAAISAGVPLVCVPMGRDQPAVAERVTHHHLGASVDPGEGVEELRSAIRQVLDDPTYRRAARQMAEAIEPADRVVVEIEEVAAARTAKQAP